MGWEKPLEGAKNALAKSAQSLADRLNHTPPPLEDIEHLGIDKKFSDVYCKEIYKKIMLECANRATIPTDVDAGGFNLTMYDSYSPYKKGLISWLVDAMVENDRLFLKKVSLGDIQKSFYVFELATLDDAYDENKKIRKDYIEIDFTEFYESQVIKLLFELLGLVLVALNKGIVISQAVILKIHKLSDMISNAQNLKPLVDQVVNINGGLRKGKMTYIDAESSIDDFEQSSETSSKMTDFIFGMIATLIGLPKSDLFSEVVTGLGNGDNGDARRENSTHRRYFYDILSGTLFSVYMQPFEYRPVIEDMSAMISAAAFIETTTLFSDEGKQKFLLNNFKGYNLQDFNLTPSEPEPRGDE